MKKIILKFYESTKPEANKAPVSFVNDDGKELHQVNPSKYKPSCVVLVKNELHSEIEFKKKYYCEIEAMQSGKGYVVQKILPLPVPTAEIKTVNLPDERCVKMDVILDYDYIIETFNINIFGQSHAFVEKRYKYLVEIFKTMNIRDIDSVLQYFEKQYLELMNAHRLWKQANKKGNE